MSDSQVRAPPFLSCLALLATTGLNCKNDGSMNEKRLGTLYWRRQKSRNRPLKTCSWVKTRIASFHDNISMCFVILEQRSGDAEAR